MGGDERVAWLQLMVAAFQLLYGAVESIEVRKTGICG
jgi:hypothetical protein